MHIHLKVNVVFEDNYSYNDGGIYNEMLEFIRTILAGLFISACNVADPDWLYSFYDSEDIDHITDEMKRQTEEWASSKPYHSLTLKFSTMPNIYDFELIDLCVFLGMKRPYLAYEDIKDDHEAAKAIVDCWQRCANGEDNCKGCPHEKLCKFHDDYLEKSQVKKVGSHNINFAIPSSKKLRHLTLKEMKELRKEFFAS